MGERVDTLLSMRTPFLFSKKNIISGNLSRAHLGLLPFIIAASSVMNLVWGQEVRYHDSIHTEVGRGINLARPDLILEPAALVEAGHSNTVEGTEFQVYYVNDKSDIVKTMRLSAAASVHALAYEGNIGVDLADQFEASENTVNFFLNARRNFGDYLFNPGAVSPNLSNAVVLMKQTMQGPALFNAVSNRFGGYFVTGYRKTARIGVLYKFHFKSESTARSFRQSLGFSSGTFDIQEQFSQALSQSHSQVQIEFSVSTLNHGSPPKLWPTNTLTSLDDLSAFVQKAENYWNSLTETNAVPTDWIVEPLQHIPGFDQLLGASSSSQFNSQDETFLQLYAALQNSQQRLNGWLLVQNGANWLSADGRKFLFGLRNDIANALRNLDAKAKKHFEDGETLDVGGAFDNYAMLVEQLPLPTIHIVKRIGDAGCGAGDFMGVVKLGPKSLTATNGVQWLTKMDSVGNPILDVWGPNVQINFDLNGFEQQIRNNLYTSCKPAQDTAMDLVNSTLWAEAKSASSNYWIGVFDAPFRANQWGDHWILALEDGAGQIVESQTLDSSLQLNANGQGASSLKTDLAVTLTTIPTAATFDAKTNYEFTVGNKGAGFAYGVEAVFPVPSGMQALRATTPQGTFSITNQQLFFDIGPLAQASTVKLNVEVVPVGANLLLSETSAFIGRLGDGLIDTDNSNNSARFPGVSVNAPSLYFQKAGDGFDLSYVSDADILQLVASPMAPGGGALSPWTPITNLFLIDGRWTTHVQGGGNKFFELRSR